MAVGYQIQFLRHLNQHDVAYIVVGGVTRENRSLQEGHDLDLWFRFAAGDAQRIRRALLEWRGRYGRHFNLITDDIPIAAGGRYLIPPFDDAVYYEHSPGDWQQVTIKDGLDIIIGGESAPTFDECFARSIVREIGPGLWVRYLHPNDDAQLPKLRVDGPKKDDGAQGRN